VNVHRRRSEAITPNMAKPKDSAPEFVKYIGPVIASLGELGGSGRPDEVRSAIAKALNISEQEQDRPLPSGVQSRFENQVHWARFYLAKGGYIDASRHGVWTLTEKARALGKVSAAQAREIYRDVAAEFAKSRGKTSTPPDPEHADEQVAPAGGAEHTFINYREALGARLQALPAAGFERFCQRLLRESGFEEVTITGRSGDGGIDGIGILQVNALVSFKVLFQCKRYTGSVTPSQVRDFRGAMMGRADKGIIITTGSFTSDARKEAVRDGVPPSSWSMATNSRTCLSNLNSV
jgi:restriction system protein